MHLPVEKYTVLTEPMLSHINVGYRADVTIAELARAIADVVGFEGAIVFDADRPDGTPRKLLDSRRLLSSGWQPTMELEQGLRLAYADFCSAEG